MKVRWKEHEMIFVTMAVAMTIAADIWTKDNNGAKHFAEAKVTFNLFVNVLMPQIGRILLIYLAYLVINFFTIPRLFFPKKFEAGTSKMSLSFSKISLEGMAKKILFKYSWLIIQIVLIGFLLGSAFTIFAYYEHEWLFHYPGFAFFPAKGHQDGSMINVYAQYAGVLFITVVYFFYACLRDIISRHLERSDKRSYQVMILNQFTAFLIFILALPLFYYSFELPNKEDISTNIFAVAMPGFLLFIFNTYSLFPSRGQKSFFNFSLIPRLLAAALITTIPFGIGLSNAHGNSAPFFILLAFQLFIITPASWMLFRQQKDKILELRGLEKALVKSKTDLQFLRSQINPHFLFNTLNTLYGTALQEKAEHTASGVQKLGDMMRFMLHENNLDFIVMSREIEYLKNYISLQKLRTQSSPQIIIEDNIAEENCTHKIAPMLLIPLVENAFKHGISLKEKSWIKINLHCDEKNIRFEVRNSMHTKQDSDPEKDKSGIGFKNVLERLKLIYGGRFQISVNGDGKEFFVQLAIQP
jgi:two-component system LytT family sensor kinase